MTINNFHYIEKCATNPIQYVVGVDQDGGWKDLTFKYASEWLITTKKLRIAEDWWNEFILSNQGSDQTTKTSKADQLLLKVYTNNAPIPKKLSEFKNHPNYVLERDLLKYQVLYPYPPPAIGYIKDIPIYSRKYVHTLQSRERWLIKEGREVLKDSQYIRRAERRLSNKEGDIELYGRWQTRKIKPKLTNEGKLPKNSFGNIELYKPWMIPEHCVHIPIQGILKVAKKHNIDAAPAVVDWEYGAHPHPVINGVVILEKDKKILMSEWKKQIRKEKQELLKKEEKEKQLIKMEEYKLKRAKEKAKAVFADTILHEKNL